jgi:Secretion system C-terminal sorting domain
MKKYLIILFLINISNNNIAAQNCWKFVASGYAHSIGIKTDGTLWGWGEKLGLLPDGTITNTYIPRKLGLDNDWRTISVGVYNTAGIKNNGTLWGFGSYNRSGFIKQIGIDSNWQSIMTGLSDSIYCIKTDGKIWNIGKSDTEIPQQIGTETN